MGHESHLSAGLRLAAPHRHPLSDGNLGVSVEKKTGALEMRIDDANLNVLVVG